MRALDRKLLRDFATLKVQAMAIAIVVAAGVALFVGTFATYRSLRLSQHQYYERQRLPHAWAALARAPDRVIATIAALPNVAAAEGRVVLRALLDVPSIPEPVTALLISAPDTKRHGLSALHLQRGRLAEPSARGEIVVSAAFADTNGIEPGDTLAMTLSGRRVALRVVGVALSPEHVMQITPAGLMDDRRFAVLWMDRRELESLVEMTGAFNHAAVRLAVGAKRRQVLAAIDRVLAPYGGRGAYDRDGLMSHVMLEEHILPLRSLALLVPSIFLLVSAFLVHVVLTRIIATQREQIGMLKAFGYPGLRIAVHYLQLTTAIVLLGIALGVPVGAWLGHVMAEFYAGFFRFPELVYRVEPATVVAAAAVAAGAAVAGTLGPLHRVLSLAPVVAMAPDVPAFRPTAVDRIGLSRLLSSGLRLSMRNVLARPMRSALTSFGMALAVAVVVLGDSSIAGFDRMVDVQYAAARREDVSLELEHPRSVGAVDALVALPGVALAEPFRTVPARVHAGARHQDMVLVGLSADGRLQRVLTSDYQQMSLPPDGIVLSAWLVRRFGLRRGEPLAIEIREGRRRMITARLVASVDEPLGVQGYLDLGALGRLLGEPRIFSGAHLVVEPSGFQKLYATLKRMPNLAGIEVRHHTVANFQAMTVKSLDFIRKIEVLFAVIIAFGVVYNSARIAVAERARELATLRVLGFRRGEISRIWLGELTLLSIPAIPIGLAAGYVLSGAVAAAATTSRMHVPLIVAHASYALAVIVFAVSALASALVVRSRLDRLDLVAVLKERT